MARRIAIVLLLCFAGRVCASVPDVNSLPFAFEKNAGHFAAEVKYAARRPGVSAIFASDHVELLLKKHSVVLRFDHAHLPWSISGEGRLSSTSNYLIGGDSSRWTTGVEQFARIRYQRLYSDIDAVFYGHGNQLEYDLVVKPGANVRRIGFTVQGARRLTVEQGDLVIHLGDGEVRCRKPVVYQEQDGKRTIVAGEYQLAGNHVRFRIGPHDETKTLIVDPVVDYASYLGGSGSEWGYAVATDRSGFVYMTGQTQSANFPTKGPLQGGFAGGGATSS